MLSQHLQKLYHKPLHFTVSDLRNIVYEAADGKVIQKKKNILIDSKDKYDPMENNKTKDFSKEERDIVCSATFSYIRKKISEFQDTPSAGGGKEIFDDLLKELKSWIDELFYLRGEEFEVNLSHNNWQEFREKWRISLLEDKLEFIQE